MKRKSNGVKISVLIGTKDRPELLLRCVASVARQSRPADELLVLDDASAVPLAAEAVQAAAGEVPVRLLRSNTPAGVVGGRNTLMHAATGSLLCILDDDATFAGPDALEQVAATFAAQPQTGIVAFKIIDHRAGGPVPLTPHPPAARRRHPGLIDQPHRVSYYQGGGHALRREVVARCGAYRHDLVYGYEELDLSFRALDAGYQIWYAPQIVVDHRPAPSVLAADRQQPARGELFYLLRNRLWVAYTYLPARYLPVYFATSLALYGRLMAQRSGRQGFLQATAEAFGGLKGIRRRPIKPETVAYLKAHYGRLWY